MWAGKTITSLVTECLFSDNNKSREFMTLVAHSNCSVYRKTQICKDDLSSFGLVWIVLKLYTYTLKLLIYIFNLLST